MKKAVLLALGAVLIFEADTSATVLTFDGLGGGNGTNFIPDTYGDRVTVTTDGNGFVYEEGSGFTPNVVVDYLPDAGFGPFTVWQGYGNLTNALGHTSFSVPGEVVLRPDPGFALVLESFDVAGFQQAFNAQVRVLNESDEVLFDSGQTVIPGDANSSIRFLEGTPIVSSSALRLDIDLYGDLGLDNVSFSQIAIPEPSGVVLGALAVGGWGQSRRRRPQC